MCVCVHIHIQIVYVMNCPPPLFSPSKATAGAGEGAGDAARGRRRLGAALLPAGRHRGDHGDHGGQRHVDAPGMGGLGLGEDMEIAGGFEDGCFKSIFN